MCLWYEGQPYWNAPTMSPGEIKLRANKLGKICDETLEEGRKEKDLDLEQMRILGLGDLIELQYNHLEVYR